MEHFEVITNVATGEQTIRPYTEQEIANLKKEASERSAEDVRSQRNSLLASCDWTQLPDAPVDQTAWAFYRQCLREITDQEGFPTNVVWPKKPV